MSETFVAARPVERWTWRIKVGSAAAQVLSETPAQDMEFRPGAFDDPRLGAVGW